MLICFGEAESSSEQGSFSTAKIWHRIAIVAAGAIVNIIFGILVYFLLMTGSGVNRSTVIQSLIPEYVSENTVLQAGDEILEMNGEKTKIKSDVDDILFQSKGEPLDILVNRNGENVHLEVTPIGIQSGEITRYILGVEVAQAEKSFANNLYYGSLETVAFVNSIGDGLIMLLTGNVGLNQMTGPVGISKMVVRTNGVYEFVYLLAVISLSLGITNLLPIPALDGGKILLLIIEAIRKKKMDEELEIKIQSIRFYLFNIIVNIYIIS